MRADRQWVIEVRCGVKWVVLRSTPTSLPYLYASEVLARDVMAASYLSEMCRAANGLDVRVRVRPACDEDLLVHLRQHVTSFRLVEVRG